MKLRKSTEKLKVDQKFLPLFEKAVFAFDFDGVLVDSVDIKTAAFASLYERYGIDVVSKVIRHHEENGGVSRDEKFRYYHDQYLKKRLTKRELQNLSEQFSTIVVEEVINADYIPGAADLLLLLQSLGKECLVISATPQKELESIIDRRIMRDFFSEVYGAPNQKSEVLKSLMLERPISPGNIVFFGDAISDWRAAKEAGVEFIGVGNLIESSMPVGASRPVWINNFEDLLASQAEVPDS